MSALLQKTKLFLPSPRTRLVERSRLLERLDQVRADGCRLALVSAPAGAGKTTVVAQWLARLGWPVGWLALDGRDNPPPRFFAYLIAAAQAAVPGVGKDALALLELPGVNLEEVVTLLANDLADAPGPFVLALDDFHTLTNPALHQAVDLLLDAQPPQMRLVLLSRQDPALQLARRRARAQLVELRQEDLRFSLPEAVAFLNLGMGLQLSTDQVEALEARTEGWIAGLQMAALSLQRAPDADRFIHEFSGSNRFILDYLVEEVLAHQPPEIQRFLLQTSILERLSASLCDSLKDEGWGMKDESNLSFIPHPSPRFIEKSGEAGSSFILDLLNRSNLFLIPLDDERTWYRYHHLFGDLLLARLQAENPGQALELYRRASDWYEAHGEPRLAVEYALKARDLPRAADLIERHAAERWQTVDLEFMLLVSQLPMDAISGRPALCLLSAWVHVLTGQAERIPIYLDAAERSLLAADRVPEPADSANLAFASTLRRYLTDYQNLPVELDPALEQAYAAIPEGNVGMRNSVAIIIGTMHFMEADFAGAMRYFEDALERDKRVNGTNAVPISVMRMVWVLQAQGRLQQAMDLLRVHEAYIRERGSRRFYIGGVIHLLWGEILLEWNRLDEAEAAIREGLRLLEDWPIPQVTSVGLSLLARLQTARGDLTGAAASLGQAAALQQKSRFYPVFVYALERASVALWIAGQDREALDSWVNEHASQAGQELRFRYEPRLVELGRAWLALGRIDEAAGLLERLAGGANGRAGSRMAILPLLAAARALQPGEPARALAVLEKALRLGEPEGYLRTFLEAGEPVRQGLKAWLQHGQSKGQAGLRAYALQVLAAFETPGQTRPHPAGLPEPLSVREQEVLQLVAKGLTNQQIATRLVISIRTVKKHVENIHGKLGVQNRTEAVARARELRLLDG